MKRTHPAPGEGVPEWHPELRALERLIARRRAQIVQHREERVDVLIVGVGELGQARERDLDRMLCGRETKRVRVSGRVRGGGSLEGRTVVLGPLLLHLVRLDGLQIRLLKDEARVSDVVEEAHADLSGARSSAHEHGQPDGKGARRTRSISIILRSSPSSAARALVGYRSRVTCLSWPTMASLARSDDAHRWFRCSFWRKSSLAGWTCARPRVMASISNWGRERAGEEAGQHARKGETARRRGRTRSIISDMVMKSTSPERSTLLSLRFRWWCTPPSNDDDDDDAEDVDASDSPSEAAGVWLAPQPRSAMKLLSAAGS